MDQTIDKLILDDQYETLSSDKEETLNIRSNLPTLSNNYLFLPFETDYLPKETNTDEIYRVSDSLIQPQQNSSTSKNDHKYRIHVGTQPGYYKEGDITFTESRKRHSEIIDGLEDVLTSADVSYELIKKDTFSNSAWGFEPYACILLPYSNEMVKGLASIIGHALQQDAIGIYSDSDEGFPHPVFTISTSDGSLFTQNDAFILMKQIPKHCPGLAGQFDKHGRNIELHNFENASEKPLSIQRIKTIINIYFGINNLFRITESIDKSDLLEKEDYQHFIQQTDLELSSLCNELIQLHYNLYGEPQST
jgi:hypothetical protein